jgi:uncharacterized protein (DUF1697 family)
VATTHLALLRGIGPGNPKMRNAELVRVFERAGLDDVRTVTSSGNVLFSSPERGRRGLEDRIEEALHDHLGRPCTAIVRSGRQLERLAGLDVFAGRDDGPTGRANVTFLKWPARAPSEPPDLGPDGEVVAVRDGAVFLVVDTTSAAAPAVVRALERAYGTATTMRTWRAVHRIAAAVRG